MPPVAGFLEMFAGVPYNRDTQTHTALYKTEENEQILQEISKDCQDWAFHQSVQARGLVSVLNTNNMQTIKHINIFSRFVLYQLSKNLNRPFFMDFITHLSVRFAHGHVCDEEDPDENGPLLEQMNNFLKPSSKVT